MPAKRRRRVVTVRRFRPSKELERIAANYLELAQQIFESSAPLDTAMRELAADGIARIVYVAYDTMESNRQIPAGTIEQHVKQWFSSREFVNWYCEAAATGFVRCRYPHRDLFNRIPFPSVRFDPCQPAK